MSPARRWSGGSADRRTTKRTIEAGPDYRVRECARRWAYEEAHKHEIGARRKFGHLKRRYADYDALRARQRGMCTICGKASTRALLPGSACRQAG